MRIDLDARQAPFVGFHGPPGEGEGRETFVSANYKLLNCRTDRRTIRKTCPCNLFGLSKIG